VKLFQLKFFFFKNAFGQLTRHTLTDGRIAMAEEEYYDDGDEGSTDDERDDGDADDDLLKGKNLYDVLGLRKEDAPSEKDVKKAYHRMAMKLHPDKNPGDEGAKEKFQTLQRVYGILGDAKKREVYDKTGRIDDAEFGGEEFQNLYEYYRNAYKEVTTEDIQCFEREYRGGEEEKRDLLMYYERYRGDMTKVFAWIMCSEEADDSHRFADALDAAIEAKDVESYDVYVEWAKEIRKRPAPKDPLGSRKTKKAGKAIKGNDADADLFALIRKKNSMRAEQAEGMFAALEAKYAPKKKTKSK
jgi:DnaJ family protein C protein 9